MTHTTVETDTENSGSFNSVYHTIDITSLDEPGAEDYNPDDEVGISPHGISVNGQEASDLFVRWDHINGQLHVTSAADGTSVASGTDVGEVVLKVDGV
jgi:hypothetical protein